jgi:beta-galactosidase GanA
MPRIYLGAPDWWRQQNPNELIVFENGQKTNFDWAAGVNRTFESIASEKWRRETAFALQAIIEHLQQADYADHIFGYMLTGMQTEEWYHYIPTGPNLGDFSRPNTAAFQQWLRRKYGGVDRLRQSWHDSTITFQSAAIPSKRSREGVPAGTFLDLSADMRAVDFHRFNNEIVAETIDYFAAVAKKATGGRKVVGAFYGYLFEHNADPAQGHQAMQKLLVSIHLDFLMVTASYADRQLGRGADYIRSQATSVALHGKLWYHDNDTLPE